jgi:hypothetical protein
MFKTMAFSNMEVGVMYKSFKIHYDPDPTQTFKKVEKIGFFANFSQ